MPRAHRIGTIERLYPDQWVVVEVTRVGRADEPLSGRVLAHSPDEAEITREAVKAADEHPEASLWTFYTGRLIPKGMVLIPGFFR